MVIGGYTKGKMEGDMKNCVEKDRITCTLRIADIDFQKFCEEREWEGRRREGSWELEKGAERDAERDAERGKVYAPKTRSFPRFFDIR